MKLILLFTLSIISLSLNAQDIFGKWKTIDDNTGKPRSIVEITKKDGNRYVTDAKTNLTYLVDEVTNTFCIGEICYKVN